MAALAAISCASFGNKEKKNDVGLTFETPQDDTPASVEVVVAATREVPQENVYATSVLPYAINNIAPQTGGRIQKINTEVGSYVYRGQILAEMDRLQLEQTKLQLRNDSTELSRIKSLYEKGGVAKSDLDAIELAYKTYFLTGNTQFLQKLEKLLTISDNIAANGHVKLQLVAGML